MNRTHYSKDEEEFDLNEGFVGPYSIIVKTPNQKGKAVLLGVIQLSINHNCIINSTSIITYLIQ